MCVGKSTTGAPGSSVPPTTVIGAAIIAVDETLKARGSSFRVPVLGAAIGIYLPLELMVPIFVGGLLAHGVERFHRLDPRDDDARDRIHRPDRKSVV